MKRPFDTIRLTLASVVLESINIPSPLMADYARDCAPPEKLRRARRANPAPRLK